jgi:hypothetical protein
VPYFGPGCKSGGSKKVEMWRFFVPAASLTVTIPEMLYRQLEAAARSSAQSLDMVVARSLERSIPSHLDARFPEALQAELVAMRQLSDDALRAIAGSVEPAERRDQINDLIDLRDAGTITEEQTTQLATLRAESEALMVRKAHAFALLKSRGHTLLAIDQLPIL